MTNIYGTIEKMDITSLMTTKGGGGTQRFKKNNNAFCDYCKMKGHTQDGCFKLIGYPANFKPKRRFGGNSAHNVIVEDANSHVGANDAHIHPAGFRSPPTFTPKQFNQLLKLINKENLPNN